VLYIPSWDKGATIDLNDIFMQDFAQLELGQFDPTRSTWHKIKAFKKIGLRRNPDKGEEDCGNPTGLCGA
jgi:hypothetical protein